MPIEFPKPFDFYSSTPDPYEVFSRIKEIKNDPRIRDYLLILINNLNSKSLAGKYAFDFYEDYKEKPWAKDIFIAAARHYPQCTIKFRKEFENEPWAEKVYINAIRGDYMYAIFLVKELLKYKWYEEVMLELSKKKEELIASSIIYSCKYFKDMPWAKKVLFNALENSPGSFFYSIESLLSLPYAKELALISAEKEPLAAVIGLKNFYKQPWAKEVTEIALKSNPEFFFHITPFELINGCTWLEDMAKSLAKKIPKDFFIFADKINKLKISEDLFIIAAQNDPEATFELFDSDLYKKIPNAKDILTIAGTHMPESSNLYFNPLFENLLKYITNDFVKKELQERIKKAYEITDIYLQRAINSDKRRPLRQKIGIMEIRGWFSLDKALKHVLAIDGQWLKPYPKTKYDQIQFKIMISRNLYFQNETPTKQNIQKEYLRILNEKNKYKNLPLFKDRNIVFAAHNETLRGRPLFGREATIDAIKTQGAKSVTLLRPQANLESVNKIKNEILKKIIETPSPATFYLDMHGGLNGVYLSDGNIYKGKPKETNNTRKITTRELAEAFNARQNKYPNEQPPILIFVNCFSGGILRDFLNKIKQNPPICISASEYYQLTSGSYFYKHSSAFAQKVLQLGKKDQITTIGTIMRNELAGTSNPTIYIPSQKGKIMQLSKKPKKELPSV